MHVWALGLSCEALAAPKLVLRSRDFFVTVTLSYRCCARFWPLVSWGVPSFCLFRSFSCSCSAALSAFCPRRLPRFAVRCDRSCFIMCISVTASPSHCCCFLWKVVRNPISHQPTLFYPPFHHIHRLLVPVDVYRADPRCGPPLLPPEVFVCSLGLVSRVSLAFSSRLQHRGVRHIQPVPFCAPCRAPEGCNLSSVDCLSSAREADRSYVVHLPSSR